MRVQQLFDLEGRRALVTGGGRGIGRHIAVGLAEAGAEVWIAARDLARCEEVAEEIRSFGGRAHAHRADLSHLEEVDALAQAALSNGGRIDVLVNNAARVWAAPTLDYPIEGWDKVFDLNVRSLWRLTQLIARNMRDHDGGSIVQIASISAWLGASDEEQPVVAYNASKGAVIALTRDLSVKLAPHGIRVNAIAPGPFLTDMMNHLRDDPEKLAAYEGAIPLRRSGREDDIKAAVVFLASRASAFMTGQTLVLDGGITCV